MSACQLDLRLTNCSWHVMCIIFCTAGAVPFVSIAQSHFGSQPGCSQGGGPPAQVGFRAAEKFGGLSSGVLGFRVILGVSVFPVWAFGHGSAFLGCKAHDNFGFGFRSFGLWKVRGGEGMRGEGRLRILDCSWLELGSWGLIRGASLLEA